MRIVKTIAVGLLLMIVAITGLVYLAPDRATRIAINLQRSASGLERKEIRLNDGHRLVYLEGGQGEPLLLVHGFAANKDHFTPVSRYLATHFRIIIPDLIGAGESDRPGDIDYSPPAQARYLHDFVQALGIKQLHMGGNSMGGHISLSYAALYRDEVTSLWLLNPGGLWNATKSEARTIFETTGRNPLLVSNEDEFAGVLNFAMTRPPFLPRPMLNVLAQERLLNQELDKKILKAITSDNAEERVRGLTVPTLIVWGADDRIIHVDTATVLQKMMPNSTVHVMKGVGHLPMLEQPKMSAASYLQFRSSI